MAWGRIDDKMHSHRKTMRIPRRRRCEAMGLWTLANSWCNLHATDGHVPRDIWDEFGAAEDVPKLLVDSGYWIETDDGYQFVNWGEFNLTADDQQAKREAETERKRKWRESKRAKSEACPTDVPAGQEDMSQDVPPESGDRPAMSALTHTHTHTQKNSSSKSSKGGRSRGTRLPEGWLPSEATREWARREHPHVNLALAHEKFTNHWLSKSGRDATKVDWDRTWRNWIIGDSERKTSRTPNGNPNLTAREQEVVKAELLKDNPDPEILRRAGIDPATRQRALTGGTP